MSEHELTEEKIKELWDAHEHKSTFFDDLGKHSKILFSSFARAAYDLGKQASTTISGSGWTDDELRAAIHAAARNAVGEQLYISAWKEEEDGQPVPSDPALVREMLDDTRHLLTALGVDHQPKPELPTEAGSVIYDAVDTEGDEYPVMALDRDMRWHGLDQDGVHTVLFPRFITSFGGVLDLDKVRGEQGE